MKLSCDVIKDLLPLYVENITSVDSNRLVQKHLEECADCTAYEQDLKEGTTNKPRKLEVTPLKFVQQDILKRKRNAIIFIALIVGLLMFITFSYLTKPRFITEKDSGVTVEMVQGNDIYINFSKNVTSCKLTNETWEGGKHIVIVEAWTSIWDDILGKSTPSLSIKNVQETVNTIYYSSNRAEDNTDNLTIIYGTNPLNGGVVILPRLVLGYYFLLVILMSAVIGVMWFIFRKREKACIISKYLFFIPVSYLIAQLLLGVDLVSFTAQRDFIMIIIAAVAIYGICILGIKLLRQHNRDRQLERTSENK